MANVYVLTQTQLDQSFERAFERAFEKFRKTDLLNQNINNDLTDRLTQTQASELLGISVQCLISWKKKKLIPFYQVGRSIFYSKAELLEVARKNPSLIKPARK